MLSIGTATLGLTLPASRAPVAILVLLGGAVADRWPRQKIMLAADVLRGITQATTGVLLLTDTAQT